MRQARQGPGSALTAALAEEGSCFAGLDPKHRVPKLKNETRLELARKLALRQHDKSPKVLDGLHIVDRDLNCQRSNAVAALRAKHMSKLGLRDESTCASTIKCRDDFHHPGQLAHWEERSSLENQAFLRFFCR
ncbi:hypothetical protein [Ensifer sp.]|uniref:hypothetical protein n=1 Tax=Ensifer sp. TaxID=1872086 RepID=UPI00289DFBD2|nr:hypothetical protein [Ensifer sp.]